MHAAEIHLLIQQDLLHLQVAKGCAGPHRKEDRRRARVDNHLSQRRRKLNTPHCLHLRDMPADRYRAFVARTQLLSVIPEWKGPQAMPRCRNESSDATEQHRQTLRTNSEILACDKVMYKKDGLDNINLCKQGSKAIAPEGLMWEGTRLCGCSRRSLTELKD